MQSYRITLGTEVTANGDRLTGRADRLNTIERWAVKRFGGFTRHDGHGGWLNAQGELVTEQSATFTIYATEEAGREEVEDFALVAANTLRQAAVAVEYPGGGAAILETR